MRPPTVVARWSGFLNSWHVIAGRPVRQRFGCYALPCRYALFARPEVTLEDLERRLVQLVEGNDSPIRAIALASCAHSVDDVSPAPSTAATSAPDIADPDDDCTERSRHIQLWPPQDMRDPKACNALSATGIAQCKAVADGERGGWVSVLHDLHPPRGVVIISSDEACKESAEMILGKYQPNGDHFQYVELESNVPMTERQLQGRGRLEPWDLPPHCPTLPIPTLADYHSTGGEPGQLSLRRHAIRLLHDVIVEMERDTLLYPFLNEPSGDSGNSLLIFGSALHNAELALLLADTLGLGWKAKRTIVDAPLAHASLLVVGSDGATAVAAPN